MPQLHGLQSIVNDLGSAVQELPDREDAKLLEIVQLGSRINYELHHLEELRQAAQGGADPPQYKNISLPQTRRIVAVKLRSIRDSLAAWAGGGGATIVCRNMNMSKATKSVDQEVTQHMEQFARIINEYLEKYSPQS